MALDAINLYLGKLRLRRMDRLAWRVFYSYSHKDHELRARLDTYLDPIFRLQARCVASLYFA
jgi:hypothetical protein